MGENNSEKIRKWTPKRGQQSTKTKSKKLQKKNIKMQILDKVLTPNWPQKPPKMDPKIGAKKERAGYNFKSASKRVVEAR